MKIALLGATGMLGTALSEALSKEGHNIQSFNSKTAPIQDQDRLNKALSATLPLDLVINAAAMTDVDGAETQEALADQVNHLGAKHVAEFCAAKKIPLIHFSTDYVFDGTTLSAYTENDTPNPVNSYGQSKHNGETAIIATCDQHYIFRIQGLYGDHGKHFVSAILNLAKEKEALTVVSDQWTSPTWVQDIAAMCNAFIKELPKPGIYHYRSEGDCNWANLARFILAHKGLPVTVKNIPSSQYPQAATRPKYSLLDTGKFDNLRLCKRPHWQESVRRFLDSLA